MSKDVMTKRRIVTWPLYPFLRYALLIISLLFLSRVMLVVWLHERVDNLENALKILGFGFRFDVIVVSFLGLVPAAVLVTLAERKWIQNIQVWFVRIWLSVLTALVVFLEISTPAFIDQYDTRPNRIFFEYLDSPVEVLRTSVLQYPWHFVAAFFIMFGLVRYLIYFNRKVFSVIQPWPVMSRLLILPLTILVLVVAARSSFGHRPANTSTAAFSNDQLVNRLGLSSFYTVVTAWNDLKNESTDTSVYGRLPEQDMLRVVRQKSFIPPNQFEPDPLTTWHRQIVPGSGKKYNLVIILEESLGAGFVGRLGGIGVTPELDKLAEQGLWFDKLYSTGTRSARGIEAVVSGFPPSPSRSVLKLGLAQQNFVTLASILKRQGYDTQFLYGGESNFDNMKGFFLSNGFDHVSDQDDFSNPAFRGTWGVSDEDLLERLDNELAQGNNGKPRFILAFSTSNHSPFEFPDHKIELFDRDKNTVNNAVKYADFAIGQFFNKARQQDYFKNTYFLVVADHDTRVFGAALVPINKFHIPGLIIGPNVQPAVYRRVASQIDLAPTLLSMMGVSSKHPMIGHDLTSLPATFPGRAIMQYGNNHAYLLGNQVVIHQPDKVAKQFLYQDGQLIEQGLDEGLAKTGQAHLLWPMYAYRKLKYLYPK